MDTSKSPVDVALASLESKLDELLVLVQQVGDTGTTVANVNVLKNKIQQSIDSITLQRTQPPAQ